MEWGKKHGEILTCLIKLLNQNNIRYFILRNYKGLPNMNSSKDVDIIIQPGSAGKAEALLQQVYKSAGLTNYYKVKFGRVRCIVGFSIQNKMTIHIDLIEGYVVKGYEIFKFDELYQNTTIYNGFVVLNKFYEGIMVFIYKQFGYRKPKLKQEYKDIIYSTYINEKNAFVELLKKLTDEDYPKCVCTFIENKDFDSVLSRAAELTKKLRKYCSRKDFLITQLHRADFLVQKITRIIFRYRKYEKSFAVMAPDGTGKTTFLEEMIETISFYYVNNVEEGRVHIYHFRPNILPNLGQLGEKVGVMKQDKNFTDPHRSKPSGFFSSLVRITYYWLDYIIGWQKCVRNDVHYDRYTVFDRYCFDLIVDPLRTKLRLPMWIRKLYVMTIPKPKIVFFLNTEADIIYARKQELEFNEIERQLKEYRTLAKSNKRFITLDAAKSSEELSNEAFKIIANMYTMEL